MNQGPKRRLLRSILPVWLVFVAVMQACPLSPTDRNLPPVIPPVSELFLEFMQNLQSITDGTILPPMITEPQPPINGEGPFTFRGYAANREDLNSSDDPLVVLFAVTPVGCQGTLERGEELATAPVGAEGEAQSASREWSMADVSIPAEVRFVAALLRVGDKEGAMSRPLAINPGRSAPAINSPSPDQTVGQRVILLGAAPNGACLSIWKDGSFVRDLLVEDKKKKANEPVNWNSGIIPTSPGTNTFSVGIRGISSVPAATLTVRQMTPSLQWPFGSVAEGAYAPDLKQSCVSGWGGTNDFYLANYPSSPNHRGLDLDCSPSVKDLYVRAVAGGKVYVVDTVWQVEDPKTKEIIEQATGINIAIDHGDWVSWYMHLENVNDDKGVATKVGDEVTAGEVIGKMGTTGRSTGVHLHLQGFFWGDVAAKEEFKKKGIVQQPGMTIINLNRSELATCPGAQGLWNLDWGSVDILPKEENGEWTSNTFNTCTEKNTCKCPED